MPENEEPHKRRIRYRGTHPRHFQEKYKEHQPEKYADQIEKLLRQGQTPAGSHRPICVQEILTILHPVPGETGLDATLGYGGHSSELLKKIIPGGKLFACDVDPIEMPKTTDRLRKQGFGPEVFSPHLLNFAGITKLLPETEKNGFDFILADLGVSSMQLDDPKRGFSFKEPGPLDLRLNPDRGKPVADMLPEWSRDDLEKILRQNADEPYAALLSEAIFAKRDQLRTTTELTKVVRETILARVKPENQSILDKTLPRVFQAFRIAVNAEFTVLEQLLRSLPFVTLPGGRIAILTFHSGEEKRVRASFEEGLDQGVYAEISTEALRPSATERYSNPRSKSARLHWAIKK